MPTRCICWGSLPIKRPTIARAPITSDAPLRGKASRPCITATWARYRAMNRIPDAIVAFREAIRLEPRFHRRTV